MKLANLLLRREDRFISLLQASAGEVQAHVRALDELIRSASPAVSLKAFLQARSKEQEIKAEIDLLLCERCSTSLDHSDVEVLARALNRIAKGLRKLAERYLICAGQVSDVSFAEQLQALSQNAETLREMVADLGSGLRVSVAKERSNSLEKMDETAEQRLLEEEVALYQGRYHPMKALMLKDLYEQFDRVLDRFRSTGDLILQIVLKHS